MACCRAAIGGAGGIGWGNPVSLLQQGAGLYLDQALHIRPGVRQWSATAADIMVYLVWHRAQGAHPPSYSGQPAVISASWTSHSTVSCPHWCVCLVAQQCLRHHQQSSKQLAKLPASCWLVCTGAISWSCHCHQLVLSLPLAGHGTARQLR